MLDFAAKDKPFGTTGKVWARCKWACRGMGLLRKEEEEEPSAAWAALS